MLNTGIIAGIATQLVPNPNSHQPRTAEEIFSKKQDVAEVLVKDQETNQSKTYVATSADFVKPQNEKIDSAELQEIFSTELISDAYALTDLNKFYGKAEVSKRISDILTKNPNFEGLSAKQQQELIEAAFPEFISDEIKPVIVGSIIMLIAISGVVYRFLKRKKKYEEEQRAKGIYYTG